MISRRKNEEHFKNIFTFLTVSSYLDRDVEYSDGIQADRLEEEDQLYREPGDGEHESDHGDESDHPPLVLVVGIVAARVTDSWRLNTQHWRWKTKHEKCLLRIGE